MFSETFDGSSVLTPATGNSTTGFFGTYGLLDYWPAEGGGVTITQAAGKDGSKGARLDKAAFHPLQPIVIDHSKKYRVRFDVRLESYAPRAGETGYPYLSAQMADVGGATYLSKDIEIKSSDWQTLEFFIDPVPSSEVSNGVFNFELSSKWGTDNVLDVDNIQVTEVEITSVNLFPAGNVETADDLAHFSFPGENPLSIWLAEGAYWGEKGLHLNDQTFQVHEDQLPTLDVNKVYKLSFWTRKRAGSTMTPGLLVYSRGGTAPEKYWDIDLPSSSNWTKVEKVFQPVGPKLYLEFWIMLGYGNIVDIDEISIQEI